MKIKKFNNFLLYLEERKEDYIFSTALKLFPYSEIKFDYQKFEKKKKGITSRYIHFKPINITIKRKKD